MVLSIDCIINNINLQNRYLNEIINEGLMLNIHTTITNIPQAQRIIYFNKLLSNLKHNLVKCKRNIYITLTPKELDEIYIKQFGKCAISKKELTFIYNKPPKFIKKKINSIKTINDFNISINRINNNLSFNKSNIQLIACRINLMKNNLNNNQFVELCSKVVKNNNLIL